MEKTRLRFICSGTGKSLSTSGLLSDAFEIEGRVLQPMSSTQDKNVNALGGTKLPTVIDWGGVQNRRLVKGSAST